MIKNKSLFPNFLWPLVFSAVALIFLITFLSFLPLRQIIQNKAATVGSTITLVSKFSSPQISASQYYPGYVHLKIDNTYSDGVKGKPVLPLRNLKVLIPYGKKIRSFSVKAGSKIILKDKYKIEPGQKAYPLLSSDELKKMDYEIKLTSPDKSIYDLNTSYPAKTVSSKANTLSCTPYTKTIF